MNEPNLGGTKAVPASENRSAPEAARADGLVAQPESAPQPAQPEQARESEVRAESAPVSEKSAGQAAENRVAPSGAAPASVAPVQLDPNRAKVERVLEDGLWDVYVSLPEKAREVFKKQGEATATAITALIAKTHVRASKIHDLIHKWLGKIPGVNEFFLLQESKIKTDTFVQLAAWILRKAGAG